MYRFLKKIILDDPYPQEYLSIAADGYTNGFSVRFGEEDISWSHIMLGYSPLVIGIVSKHEYHDEIITISFNYKGKEIANLKLKFITSARAGYDYVYVYEGIKGKHKFIPVLKKAIIGLRQYSRNMRKGNVRLSGNKYDQVRIAYSVPREISIVTTGKGNLFNMFPTDLHGRINNQHYIDSLRISGKACSQVEETGRMVLSRVEAGYYKTAYALGKNHMAEMKERSEDTKNESEIFRLPVPDAAISYLELERTSSFDAGIHRIHLFKIVNEKKIMDSGAYLCHLHNYAAEWRKKNGIITNYLYR